MKQLLLILVIFFSLTQLVSAERWRGLIASVAALESAKEQKSTNLTPVPKSENITSKLDKIEYKKEATEDSKKLMSPSATITKTTKTYTKRRFQLFRRRCLFCK